MRNKILILLSTMVVFAGGTGLALAKEPSHPGAAHEKVTLCHRTSSATNPYVTITVNFNSIQDAQHVGGHVTHLGDIIPPFTYTDSHGKFTFAGQGDQSILKNGCKVKVPVTTTTTTTTPVVTTTTTVAPTPPPKSTPPVRKPTPKPTKLVSHKLPKTTG
jgi:hypothetical protein